MPWEQGPPTNNDQSTTRIYKQIKEFIMVQALPWNAGAYSACEEIFALKKSEKFDSVITENLQSDYSPPSSAEVKEWVELYLHSPNTPSWRGARLKKSQRQLYLYVYYLLSHASDSRVTPPFQTFRPKYCLYLSHSKFARTLLISSYFI
jgi:hypothetical protein